MLEFVLKNPAVSILLITSVASNIALIYRLWFKSEVTQPQSSIQRDIESLKTDQKELEESHKGLISKIEEDLKDARDEIYGFIDKHVEDNDKEFKQLNIDKNNLWKNKVETITFKDEMQKIEKKFDSVLEKYESLNEKLFKLVVQLKGVNSKDD